MKTYIIQLTGAERLVVYKPLCSKKDLDELVGASHSSLVETMADYCMLVCFG